MKIKRTVIKEGEYNGVFYSAKELEKGHKSLVGVPITIDFSFDFKDRIGTVTNSKYNKKAKSIICTLDLKDKRNIIEKIKKKLIAFSPSMVLNLDNILDIEGKKIIATDIKFESISAIPKIAIAKRGK